MGSCHTNTETASTTIQMPQNHIALISRKLQNLPHVCISMPLKRKEISKQQNLTKYLQPITPSQIDVEADIQENENTHQESKADLYSSMNQQICEEKKDEIYITDSDIVKYNIQSFLKALPLEGPLFQGIIYKVLASKTISRYGIIDRESFRYYTSQYSSQKWLSKPLLLLKISYIKKAIR